MCEFCTTHGDGKIWYKNAANFSQDLAADLDRRKYIREFLESTIKDGFNTLGRLEALYSRKGRLPGPVALKMRKQAEAEHFGQVLPIEEIRDLVMKAHTVVRMPCACRWTAFKKEKRCCYGISFSPDAWYKEINMGYFGMTLDEGLESLGREEALSQMEELEKEGAVHTIWTMLTPFIGAICNCTAGDCIAMKTLAGIRVEIMARAEYTAKVDEDLCVGCGLCAGRCQFNAIGSTQQSGSFIARVDERQCFGCGLCRRECEVNAISLVPRI